MESRVGYSATLRKLCFKSAKCIWLRLCGDQVVAELMNRSALRRQGFRCHVKKRRLCPLAYAQRPKAPSIPYSFPDSELMPSKCHCSLHDLISCIWSPMIVPLRFCSLLPRAFGAKGLKSIDRRLAHVPNRWSPQTETTPSHNNDR